MDRRKLAIFVVPGFLLVATPPTFTAYRRTTLRADTGRGLHRISLDLREAMRQRVPFPTAQGSDDNPNGEIALVRVLEQTHGIDGGYLPWRTAVWFSRRTDSWAQRSSSAALDRSQ